jgi:hypothetical protein
VRLHRARRLIAILRADVDCRALRQARTPEDVVEFGSVVARKEDVVANERKALRASRHRPGEGRERPLGCRSCANGARGFGSCASVRERSSVPVPDDGVRRYAFALVGLHACCAAFLDEDPRDSSAKAQLGAASSRELRQRLGEARHAAFNDPNALALDVSNQHERRGSEERRRPAISGVSPEKLAQAGIGEMIFERARQCRERRYPHEIGEARESDPHRQFDGAWPRSADETVAQRPIDRLGAFAKTTVAVRLARPCEIGDRLGALVDVGIEIKARAIAPGMARESHCSAQGDRF